MHESEKVKVKSLSCVRLLGPHGLQVTRLLHPWDFSGKILEWGAIAFSKASRSRVRQLIEIRKKKNLHG